MREVTRYQAPDGTLHETAEACERHEANPPEVDWGIYDELEKRWVTRLGEIDLYISREAAQEELTDWEWWVTNPRSRYYVAQYSARPPQPRGEGEHGV